MSDEDANGTRGGEAPTSFDGSLRIDPRTLSSNEQDFARLMGFGDDGRPAAESSPAPQPAAAAAPDAPPAVVPRDAPGTANESTRDWEEIHPRAAALGRQTALLERASRVPTLEADASERVGAEARASTAGPIAAKTEPPPLVAGSAPEGATPCTVDTAACRTAEDQALRIAELEKTVEQVRSELDGALVERDRLLDAIALANAARSEAEARADRLASVHRATRTPSGPLPEGERALRAEVVGLRRRLEEASSEAHRLHARLDEAATDLAIARAQSEDRVQDLEAQQTRLDALEREQAAEREQLVASLARQRELAAQLTRVQAENVELRSTQTELEERLKRREARIAALAKTLARVEEAIGRGSTPREHHASAEEPVDLAIDAPASHHRPATLGRWRDAQIRLHAADPSRAGLADYLAHALLTSQAATPSGALRITSLAGDALSIEVELVRALAARGRDDVAIRVVGDDGPRVETRQRLIAQAGLANQITVERAGDGADARTDAPADVLLIVDALFGRTAPEALLERALAGASETVRVLFADRLAGGPITLSERTSEKLAELWTVLPEHWTDRPAFSAPPRSGDDGGTPGWEKDQVALLGEAGLVPSATIGFGHVADLFLGAARGPDLDASPDAAEALLASIDAIDESRCLLEQLPPRHGAGIFLRRASLGGAPSAPPETIGLPWPGR